MDSYEIRRQDGEIVLFGGLCKLFFGGLDSQETINKFNSAELAFFALDQAEETNREEVSVLRGSLRLKIGNKQPSYKELYTANPADCWLKDDFIDHKTDGYVYIPALPSDNPYLPDNYISTLEEAFKYSEPLLKAYRDGDWQSLKGANTLLSTEDLNRLKGVHVFRGEEKRVVAIDPATSYDECVVYYMKDYKVEEEMIIVGESDTMKIAGRVVALANKHDCKDIGGDVIGLGKGLFDRIAELGEYTVHPINSAASKHIDNKFKNMRALVYWTLMEKVLDKQVEYPEDEELRRQLTNITYEVTNSNGQIQITGKDKIKKVLGRSPDRADCFAYAVYLTGRVAPYEKKKGKYRFDSEEDYPFNPATV